MINADKQLRNLYTFATVESTNEFNRNKQELLIAHKQYTEGENKGGSILNSAWQLLSVYRWNLFVGCMLHVFQQFAGFNIVQYYGPYIIRDAGFM